MVRVREQSGFFVKLTDDEMRMAAQRGIERHIDCLRRGLTHLYGADHKDGWAMNIEGACGELVVAQIFGLYWCGNLGNFAASDVGPLEVRTCRNINDPVLSLWQKDKDEAPFLLVVGNNGEYELVGWTFPADWKRQEYWRDHYGKGRYAYCVLPKDLRPMGELFERAADWYRRRLGLRLGVECSMPESAEALP